MFDTHFNVRASYVNTIIFHLIEDKYKRERGKHYWQPKLKPLKVEVFVGYRFNFVKTFKKIISNYILCIIDVQFVFKILFHYFYFGNHFWKVPLDFAHREGAFIN